MWNLNQHMYMINTNIGFHYLNAFIFAQTSEYNANVSLELYIYCLPSEFWNENNMILAIIFSMR